MIKNYPNIVDAQEMSKLHPDTFEAPTQEELDSIVVGYYAKVCICKERFWTMVKSIDGDEITATIENDLIFTSEHGLVCDDEIKFNKKNIFQILIDGKK